MFGAPGSLTETALAEARTAGGAPAVPEEWGTFPRTVLELLASRPKLSTHSLHASAVEVYQDAAYDLLDDRKPLAVGSTTRRVGLKLGGGALQAIGKVVDGKGAAESKGADHHGVHPPGCRCGKCFVANKQALAARLAARDAGASKLPALPGKAASTAAKRGVSGGGCSFETRGETLWPLVEASDVARLARTVELTRQTVGHALNARSSRSHCLVTVHLTERPPAKGAARGKSGVARRSRLLFVDLAGSERIKKTGVEGSAKDQALAINGSLTALGKVIRALSTKAAHVPFRDSTLTMLLRESLGGGKTLTSVVINVASEREHEAETSCSLEFGRRLASLQTNSMATSRPAGEVAGVVSAAEEAQRLEAEIEQVVGELAQLEAGGFAGRFGQGFARSEVHSYESNVRKLAEEERRLNSAQAQLAEAKAGAKCHAAQHHGSGELEDLEKKAGRHKFEVENLRMIILRQRSIKGFYVPPSKAFVAKQAELKDLRGRLRMISG